MTEILSSKSVDHPAQNTLLKLNTLSKKLGPDGLQEVAEVFDKSLFSRSDLINIFAFIGFTIVALNLDLDHNSFILYKLTLYFLVSTQYVFFEKSAYLPTLKFLGIFIYQILSSAIAFYYLMPLNSAKKTLDPSFHIQAENNDIAVNSICISITYSFFKYPQDFVDKSKKFYVGLAIVRFLLVEISLPSFSVKLLVYYFFYLLILWAQFYFVEYRLRKEREKFQSTWTKTSAELQQDINKLKDEIELSYKNVSSPFTASDADQLLMKLKFLKFQLMAEENPVSRILRPGAKKLSEKIEKKRSSSGIGSSNMNLTYEEGDSTPGKFKLNNWKMQTRDIDAIIENLISRNPALWMPDLVTNAKGRGLSQEAADFVLTHFTENLRDTAVGDDVLVQPTGPIDSRVIENNPLNNFLEANVCNWNFDMFKLRDLSTEGYLLDYGFTVFRRFKTQSLLNVDVATIQNFFRAVKNGYRKNPYHNSLHGVDVTNSVAFLFQNGLQEYYNPLEINCTIISALVHDIGHPGFNNAFLVLAKAPEAMIYNDQSVLENFHTATFFKILQYDSSNILKGLAEKEWKSFRKLSISLIIDTDLQKHFVIMNKFKNMVALKQYNMKEDADKHFILSATLKAADIAHGAKEIGLHKKWSRRIIEEFYLQGDREAQLKFPVTPMCDRKGNISKSQEGFLKVICLPLFEALDEFLAIENVGPEIRKTCVPLIKGNLKYWEEEQKGENEGKGTFLTEMEKVKQEIVEEIQLN